MKWSKIIFFSCVFFIISCRKLDITPTPQPMNKDIFSQKEVSISDGQLIEFSLKTTGRYTLTLFDSTTTQVVSREKIAGRNGINNLKIYTKSLSSKYLYLILRDSVNNELGKTLLLIK
jgi:hypothetical protein